jgi:hypothetical protein
VTTTVHDERDGRPTASEPWPLDALAGSGWPLAEPTAALFAGVRDHDLERLSALCDDEHGIVDIAPDGSSVVIPDRAAWRAWFERLFAQLD